MTPFKRKQFALASLLLLGLLSVAFYDVFFFGKTFKVTTATAQAMPYGVYGQRDNKPEFIPVNGTDAPLLEEPVYEFIKATIKRGVFPLWNPHQGCGYPLIALIQVGILFPLNFLLYLLPSYYAWDVLIAARFLLAGILTFAFMRQHRFGVIPSFGAAVCFMLSGPMVLLQYWTVNVDILLPLVLMAFEHFLRRPEARRAGEASLCVALTILAGHPEHIFLVNVFAVCYFAFRGWALYRFRRAKQLAGGIVFIYALGAGLAAIVLFPFLDNFHTQLWNAHPPAIGLTTGEIRHKFLSIALPHFFQKVPLTYDFHFAGWWGGYVGTLPLVLALAGLFHRRRRALSIFFVTTAALIIAKCYAVPVINWIGYLPVFNLCRFYIHTTHLFSFAMAVAAGIGLQYVLTQKRSVRVVFGFCTMMTAVVAVHLAVFRQAAHFSLSLRAAGFCLGLMAALLICLALLKSRRLAKVTAGVLLVLLVSFELFSYIHRERPSRFDSFVRVPYIEWLKEQREPARSYGIFGVLYPNTATGYQVDDLGIFFGLVPKRFVQYVNTLLVEDLFRDNLRPPALRTLPVSLLPDRRPFLDILNQRFTLAPPDIERKMPAMTAPGFPEPVYDNEVKIFSHASALPRAFIVHRIIFEPHPDAVLARMKDLKSALRYVAVVESEPDPTILQQLASSPIQDRSGAEITRDGINRVKLKVVMRNPGLLILADAFHPDWRVTVNGKPRRLFAVDHLLRGVFLPTGEHTVEFVFRPFSFYAGGWVSLACALLCAGLIFGHRQKGTGLSDPSL